MKIKIFTMLLSSCLMFGCTVQPQKTAVQTQYSETGSKSRELALKQRIYAYTQDETAYDVAFNDLNEDGFVDAVVMLKGMDWCGSGGCTLLVFEGQVNSQFELLSKATVVDTPVYATYVKKKGWKSLLVSSRGHGQVVLEFDGKKYASNPSILPMETNRFTVKRSQLLLANP